MGNWGQGGFGQIGKTGFFGKERRCHLGQKAASPKCGSFFCIHPGTDVLLLELKHCVSA